MRPVDVTTQQIGAKTRELRFDLENNSIFNYRDVEVRALLYNRGDVIAVKKMGVSDILSDTISQYSLRWFYSLPQVTNWKVELSTNVFDPDNILPFTIEQFESIE